MKKDVIYIDIEDDITSIIEKVKEAGSKVIALVPPKRAGALQSVVNLKLLQRTAEADDKRLVLITNDRSLTALASGVQIPVAKNLQSKPELAPVAALAVDDEEIIDGDTLSVGDHAKTAPKSSQELESQKADKALAELEKSDSPTDKKNKKTPKGIKVPDFGRFRKWLFIGIGAFILLVGFLVWAIVYAPRATVAITANTTPVDMNIPLILAVDGETDIGSNTLRPERQEIKKTETVEFEATGQKEVGEKATGTMTLRNGSDSDPIRVPAGTRFSSGNYTFTSDSATTVPGAKVSGGSIVAGKATVKVTAVNIGADYNLPSRAYSTEVDGISARGSNMSGGSKRTITVVSSEDVEKARGQIQEQNEDAVKNELKGKFNDAVVIDESFVVATGEPQVAPAVGEEASNAKLTLETTYTMLGLKRQEVNELLDTTLKADIEGSEDQRIYDNGSKAIAFEGYEQAQGGNISVRLKTTGQIGPNIKDEELKQEIEGMRYGEVQQRVESIQGVESVKIDFWPFWVTSVPSPDKVTIEFILQNE